MLKSAVIAGLLAEGVKVHDADLIPTPGLQFNVKNGPYDGGVMITASHNPPEYNGIKVIGPDGIEIPHEDERVIEEYYFSGQTRGVPWSMLTRDPQPKPDAIDVYINGILEHVDVDLIRQRRFKVVIDCASSVGGLVTPRLLTILGAKYYSLNCNLDPLFPGREPEPTPQTLREAAALAVSVGADLVVGHDGDADRAILGDERGRVVWGDRDGTLLSAFAGEIWRELPRRVYTGVSSSILVEEYLKPRGIDVVWTPVGSVTISRTIVRDGGAISGFEENGGYMHTPHQIVRDGPMKVALTLYMLAKEKRSLGEMLDELPVYYPLKTKLPATRQQALCAVEKVKEYFSNYRQVTIDGVKVLGDGFWVLVRPSGTEPVVRIMLEARTPEDAEKLLDEVKRVIAPCLSQGGSA